MGLQQALAILLVTAFAASGAGPGVVFSEEVRGTGDRTPYSVALDAVGTAYVAQTVSSSAAACQVSVTKLDPIRCVERRRSLEY